MRDSAGVRPGAGQAVTAAAPVQLATPGKQTRVMSAPTGDVVQCKPAVVQRKGPGTKGDPPAPFYQYQDKTDHWNDCGPASIITVLRMLDAEGLLKSWVIAHRPVDMDARNANSQPNYLKHYGYAAVTDPVGPQEELDAVRRLGSIDRSEVKSDRLTTPPSDHSA